MIRSIAILAGCLWLQAAAGCSSTPLPPPGQPGLPITAAAGQWTWVDFPDSACDDGTATGIGINPSATGSSNLLVFFDGGGACWDYLTCAVLNTSVHGPFGPPEFQARLGGSAAAGSILDRALPGSPFKEWNLVYVPYCTGDLHGGDNVKTYSSGGATRVMHHVGHANVEAYLSRLAPTFPHPARLVVAGSSAGGYGALLNYDAFRQAWTSASAYLIDDSGPPLEQDAIAASLRMAWFSAWNLAALTDPLCGTGCHDDLSLLFAKLGNRHPHDRLALLSSEQDAVIRAYLLLAPSDFQTDLLKMSRDVLDPLPEARYFFVPGQSHTFLGAPGAALQSGVSLLDFLRLQVTDDAAWASVKP